MRRAQVVTLLVVLLFQLMVFAQLGRAEYLTEQKDTLKGVKRIVVLVTLSPELIDAGLSADDLRTDAELKLKMAGVEVVKSEKADAYLYMTVTGFKSWILGGAVYRHDLQLRQWVSLLSNPNTTCLAPTWTDGSVSLAKFNDLSSIYENLGGSVNKFVKDYLAVNPKK